MTPRSAKGERPDGQVRSPPSAAATGDLARLFPARLLSSTVPSPLSAAIDDLLPVMRRGDLAGFQQIFSRLHHDGRGLPPDELTAAVGELAPVLGCRPEGVFAPGADRRAFVEWGGSALPLAASVPACTLLTMLLRARFSELWSVASGGRPEPGTGDLRQRDEHGRILRQRSGQRQLQQVGHRPGQLGKRLLHRNRQADRTPGTTSDHDAGDVEVR